VQLSGRLEPVDQALLCDPQTSGGLLLACAPAAVDAVLAIFQRHGFEAAVEVGEIVAPAPQGVRLRVG
jgi:selenide,water dikinase